MIWSVEYRDEHVMWSYIYVIFLIAINNDLLEILLIRLQYLSLKHINLVLLVVEIIFLLLFHLMYRERVSIAIILYNYIGSVAAKHLINIQYHSRHVQCH